jgi:transcriptional regulator with XRE-family HTH domain
MSVSLYHAEYQTLRNALRNLRREAKFTQIEMAEKLHLGQSFVSKIERGENFVDVMLFARWCQVCNANPGEVLNQIVGEN